MKPGLMRTLTRAVLLAPGPVRSAAARRAATHEERWMLTRPRHVRESYVREVLDRRGDRTLLSTAWLLRQPADVRDSYVREVVDPQVR